MRIRTHEAAAALLAAAGLSLAVPAGATIVWEGKQVVAWPDIAIVQPANGAQLALSKQLFPHPSGVVHGLTILVDFSDQAAAYSKEDVDAWLNQAGFNSFGLKGSVRDYYLGQSLGKVDYQNEVHGFYRAKKPKSYYNDGGYERADELWDEVVAALDAEIDYSKFDNDGDGKTEAISLLYAGGEGTFGKGLWPHATSSNQERDGVRLNRYMMTAMNSKPTNYVFAHESGHMLFGWPDLYGVGDYCIMANRGSDSNPVGINDMFRADQGWVDVVDIDASTNARLSSSPDGVVYRFLNAARPTEYFLWSNLENQREWASIRGSGLLVWHFDNAIRGNNPPEPLQLAVVQAGGSRQLADTTWPSPGSAATDLFVQGGNSELGPQGKPSTSWNDGSESGLRIYDVSAPGTTLEFSVGTGPLPPAGVGGSASNGGAGGASGGQGGASAGDSSSAGKARARKRGRRLSQRSRHERRWGQRACTDRRWRQCKLGQWRHRQQWRPSCRRPWLLLSNRDARAVRWRVLDGPPHDRLATDRPSASAPLATRGARRRRGWHDRLKLAARQCPNTSSSTKLAQVVGVIPPVTVIRT